MVLYWPEGSGPTRSGLAVEVHRHRRRPLLNGAAYGPALPDSLLRQAVGFLRVRCVHFDLGTGVCLKKDFVPGHAFLQLATD